MSTKTKGTLVVVSGFSGAGKGTIMKGLMEKYGDNFALSVSATTRSPRPGEIEGVHYFFKTKEEFENMIANGELVEYAAYVNSYYGTPKSYVDQQLEAGKNVILEIEMQGAFQVKEKFPETVLLFVTTPSATELRNRLVGRGTETPEVIEARLSQACRESMRMHEYDYLIINDDLEKCIDSVNSMIMNESLGNKELNCEYRMSSNQEFIDKMKQELNEFWKGDN